MVGILCGIGIAFFILIIWSCMVVSGKESRREEAEEAKIQSTVGINASKDESSDTKD